MAGDARGLLGLGVADGSSDRHCFRGVGQRGVYRAEALHHDVADLGGALRVTRGGARVMQCLDGVRELAQQDGLRDRSLAAGADRREQECGPARRRQAGRPRTDLMCAQLRRASEDLRRVTPGRASQRPRRAKPRGRPQAPDVCASLPSIARAHHAESHRSGLETSPLDFHPQPCSNAILRRRRGPVGPSYGDVVSVATCTSRS